MSSDRIDLMFNSEPVCPHCSRTHQDASEWSNESSHECYSCGKEFWTVREIEVTYTTSKDKP